MVRIDERLTSALLRSPMLFHRAPRLVFGVADILQQTLRALRASRDAQRTPMMDHLVREQRPALARDDLHQVLLDADRIVILRQLQSTRDAMHVRVDYYAIILLEPRSEHDVSGLSCHAGNG